MVTAERELEASFFLSIRQRLLLQSRAGRATWCRGRGCDAACALGTYRYLDVCTATLMCLYGMEIKDLLVMAMTDGTSTQDTRRVASSRQQWPSHLRLRPAPPPSRCCCHTAAAVLEACVTRLLVHRCHPAYRAGLRETARYMGVKVPVMPPCAQPIPPCCNMV